MDQRIAVNEMRVITELKITNAKDRAAVVKECTSCEIRSSGLSIAELELIW